mmetsp:Transcript_11063/g.33023  ORF Transcript_11063/g.33023 Transcript_11063/m.33023 type:complete len:208 (-) Transcript_11063:195-818(-)
MACSALPSFSRSSPLSWKANTCRESRAMAFSTNSSAFARSPDASEYKATASQASGRRLLMATRSRARALRSAAAPCFLARTAQWSMYSTLSGSTARARANAYCASTASPNSMWDRARRTSPCRLPGNSPSSARQAATARACSCLCAAPCASASVASQGQRSSSTSMDSFRGRAPSCARGSNASRHRGFAASAASKDATAFRFRPAFL